MPITSIGTSRFRRSTKRRSGAAKGQWAMAARSWCAPACIPAARPTTSSSSRTGASRDRIDWGKTNKPISPERYRALYNRMIGYAQRRDLFARDCWAGADPAHRIGVRVVTETAWHNLFARNMFLRPRREELVGFKPDFTILNLPGFQADPALDGTASDCAILVNFTDRVVAICGTWYAGEIKKSVFTILNYLLPDKNVLPMHASANIGPEGRRGDLLRPVRHRQDDPVGRSVAHPDRRRRARLGRDQPLQLRRRLLRQGDQAEPRGRAGDLRHHRTLRHGARERRDGLRRPAGSISTTAATPRTPAPAIRWTSSPTPAPPASPARRRTSSC